MKMLNHEGPKNTKKRLEDLFFALFVSSWLICLSFTLSVSAAPTTQQSVPNFRNDIQPLLTRMGCNSGACHGAAAGKNGFKLSLRGYDDMGDWKTITRSALGRRVVPENPAQSLLLLKPTATIPHKGGLRFAVGSKDYQLLADWIAGGAPGPSASDPRIVGIEMRPNRFVLRVGAVQQIHVIAHFSDGSERDVSHWAKYTANDTSVATIDEEGKATVVGRGEGSITAWYLSRINTATISVPYANPPIVEALPHRNFIDDLVNQKLRDLNLPPSPPATDEEFLRRAYIDTLGILPSADKVKAFLADQSPSKRDALIDELLNRPEFVDYWTYKWSDLLLVNSFTLRSPPATLSYYNWIRRQVEANTPWDQFVRKIVTATGSTLDNGAANFYVLHNDPTKMAETVSQAFMGMSVNCAKCHNHPMEKWTNNQYYAFANLFARVRAKNAPGDGNFIVFSDTTGDVVQPLTGKPQPPAPLDGKPLSMDDPGDRRIAMANWLVSPENPYFTRSIVNRVWANFMGVGLVEAVDDMRMTNPPSNEPLLAALSEYLVQQHYDLKALMRLILQSDSYQRSGEAIKPNEDDRKFYSHYYPKRFMAEVMLDAVSQVTGAPTAFPNYPAGTRALQLPDSNVDSYFLRSFGRPDRLATCECERTSLPSMAQALHMANGDTINAKLSTKGNRLDQLLEQKATDQKIIEEVFLSALSRYPTAEESKLLSGALAKNSNDRRHAIEDLYWAVLSSKGFCFNH